jgi:hypothetical protein
MRVLLAVAVVLLICLLFAADRAFKAIRRGMRRRDANERLAAVAAAAEAREQQRRAASEASGALTSVMPAIHEHDPRHVDLSSPIRNRVIAATTRSGAGGCDNHAVGIGVESG